MKKYECPCGYVYDPEEGDYERNIDAGTGWDELPEDWLCPKCDSEQDYFEEVEE